MKTLVELQAQLRAKQSDLATLKTKAFSAGATTEDQDAVDACLDEMDQLDVEIKRLKRVEEMEARTSVPALAAASTPAAGAGHNSLPAGVKDVNEGVKILGICGAAAMIGKLYGKNPNEVLEDDGYGGLVQKMRASVTDKAVNTLVSADGGILVPAAVIGGIVPLLRPETSFLQANPTPVPLVNGKFTTARGASGATAAYVGQGALKPISSLTFDAIDMAAKKLAGIVVMTEEAVRWTIGDIAAYIENDMRLAMAQTLDLNAWFGTGSGSTPLGILNKSGVTTVTQTFAAPAAPTLAELDSLRNKAALAFTNNLLTINQRVRWVMSQRTALTLASVRNSAGDLAFPGMQGATIGGNLNWYGIPVMVSAQFPTNGGGTTDEATIALIDFGHVFYGEEMDVTVRYSSQATLTPDGTALIHLWQSNQSAILAESMHDFGLRFSKAVVKATVRF